MANKQSGLSTEMLVAAGVTAVIVVGGLIAAGLIIVFRPSQPETTAAPTAMPLDTTVPTAREAYPPAVEAIREMDAGAQLASGAGAWFPDLNPAVLAAGRTGWTFSFYLPGSQEMAAVIVDRGGQATVAEVAAWETPPNLRDDQNWRIDSSEVMAAFSEYCREELAQDPAAWVEARLTTAADQPGLMWHITAISSESNRPICEISVDATTGIVR